MTFFFFLSLRTKSGKENGQGANMYISGGYLNRLLYSRRWIDACGHDYAESGLG